MNDTKIDNYQMYLSNLSNNDLKELRKDTYKMLELIKHEIKMSDRAIKEGMETEHYCNCVRGK